MELLNQINKDKLPTHIAVIMDGNGRWGKQNGKSRIDGHYAGVKSVQNIVEGAGELGIKYLTLYAFSTENWNRPQDEISALFELLVKTIASETNELIKKNVVLKVIGNVTSLTQTCQSALTDSIQRTSHNNGLTLILALNYSSKSEIVSAIKNINMDIKNEKIKANAINEQLVNKYLYTHQFPDPELMIRTSGEHRLSNFLLWQLAYAELYFTDVLWPDFRKSHLHQAIIDFQSRERRFGKVSEQLK